MTANFNSVNVKNKKIDFVPLNASVNDTTNDEGVRVSVPVYVDLTHNQRKEILNNLRAKAAYTEYTPHTASGISTVTTVTPTTDIESFIGMSIEVLRGVIFQRGGMPVDLVLRLQTAAGVEFVNEAMIKKAFSSKQKLIQTKLQDFQECNV